MPAQWRYWRRVESLELAVVRSSLLTARRVALLIPGGPGVGWPKCDADEVVAGMDAARFEASRGHGIHRACDMQPPFPNRGHAVCGINVLGCLQAGREQARPQRGMQDKWQMVARRCR